VDDIDREDTDMKEDMTIEMEVVKREHEGMVLTRHWTGVLVRSQPQTQSN
jgi:hypothetical protein